jgi:hypothetical protein
MSNKATKKKLCFVVGPIGREDSEIRIHADWLLEEIIQPVLSEFHDYEVKRADQDPRPGLIDAQLINDLLTADLVIADLSGINPNAFYEIGIRHMAQKPIIHMQLADDQIPFDVSLYRAIKFSRTRPRDIRAARNALKAQVAATLEDGYQVENPVTSARGRVQLEQHATPGQQVLLDGLRSLTERVASLEGGKKDTLAGSISEAYVVQVKLSTSSEKEVDAVIGAILNIIPRGHVAPIANDILEAQFRSASDDVSRITRQIANLKGVFQVYGPKLNVV